MKLGVCLHSILQAAGFLILTYLPPGKTGLFPEHGSLFIPIPRDEYPEHTKTESLEILIILSPSCLRFELPGKESAAAYINNDKKIKQL